MNRICPDCGGKLVRVVYGLPGDETFEKAERRELYLGGCRPGPYDYHCYACGRSFREESLESRKETEDAEE